MKTQHRWSLLAGGAVAILAVAAVGLAAAHGNGYGTWWGGDGFARPGFNDTSGSVDGSFVTLSSDAATATLSSIDLKDANLTHPLVSSLRLSLPADASATTRSVRGGYLLDDGAGDRVLVADSPGADVTATSVNGTTLTIAIPDGAAIAT